jgi:phosphate-selective porin OprO and OprP
MRMPQRLACLPIVLAISIFLGSSAASLAQTPPVNPPLRMELGFPFAEPGKKAQEGKEEPVEKEKEKEERAPLYALFSDGVLLATTDDEFQLRIHVLAQIDYKLFTPAYQVPARSGVYIPRFRAYFEGRATRSFEYELSLQRSVEGTFDVLDANINFRPSDSFQVRAGRTLVPYSYEWYDHLEQFFIVPERSLYPLNFGLSRQAGVMFHGKANDERIQYAVGGFAGQLAGVADNNTSRDAVGYINVRPFLTSEEFPLLRYLNIGGSLALGRQVIREAPLPMRTSLQSSENDEAAQGASTVFLEFNNGVSSFGGGRVSGAVHMAWYVNQLSFESEWQSGRFPYIRPGLAERVLVPAEGFSATFGYFITGEQVEGRKQVIPLHPFNPVSGLRGCGAIEPFARYSRLTLGEEVFTAKLADPELWTRSAQMTDIGVNWYPNRFLKFTFDWQHTAFGTPVMLNEAQGKTGRSVDLYWVRCQVWY